LIKTNFIGSRKG